MLRCGVWVYNAFLDLHQQVLENLLLFELLLQGGQQALLKEVKEFLAAVLLPAGRQMPGVSEGLAVLGNGGREFGDAGVPMSLCG